MKTPSGNRNDARRGQQFSGYVEQQIDRCLLYCAGRRLASMTVPVRCQIAKSNYLLDRLTPPRLHCPDGDSAVHSDTGVVQRMGLSRQCDPICSSGTHCFPQILCIVSVVKSAKPRTTHFLPKSSQAKTFSSSV